MKLHVFSTLPTASTDEATSAGRDLLSAVSTWLGGALARRRAAISQRALRRQLADMDEMMLRDIGIEEGEIWHIRQQRQYTSQGF